MLEASAQYRTKQLHRYGWRGFSWAVCLSIFLVLFIKVTYCFQQKRHLLFTAPQHWWHDWPCILMYKLIPADQRVWKDFKKKQTQQYYQLFMGRTEPEIQRETRKQRWRWKNVVFPQLLVIESIHHKIWKSTEAAFSLRLRTFIWIY